VPKNSPAVSKGELALHEAARTGKEARLEELLTIVKVDCRNNLNRTALHMAASKGQTGAVRVLLEYKAGIELADKYGMTALMWATYFGHIEVVELLLERSASVKKRNKLGMHALHIAADQNNCELVRLYLTKTKKSILNDTEKNGQTALMIAAGKGNIEVVQLLLSYPEVDLMVKDAKKMTALHLAAENGCAKVLEELLREVYKLRDLVNEKDESERIPLHYAVEKGHIGAIRCLLTHGSEVNATAEREMTAFHLAAVKGHMDVLKYLKEHGANVNALNLTHSTALHYAALNDSAEQIFTLVSLGCETSLPNNRNQTPLHLAVEQNKPNAAEALLLCDAPINVRDKTGKTPLILATRGSYISMVDMIIKAERYRERKKRQQSGEAKHPTALVDQLDSDGAVYKPADYENRININEPTEEELEQEISADDAMHNGTVPTYRLREFQQPYAEEFKQYLWKLAFKHLRQNEWKKLAAFWQFKTEHVEAIEHQYTGGLSKDVGTGG
uniref:ANK_REP_REGION domain-containing protein n=1 Tax=Macrostomum lignano TaxID=282301 RepID=A0A1I8H2H0_9PLAT